jgi:hypothetical protein
MNSRPVRLNHRKSEFPAKNAFGKNQFSQPWNVRFARSNSRFLTTDHKISNGAIRFGFGAREAGKFPYKIRHLSFKNAGAFFRALREMIGSTLGGFEGGVMLVDSGDSDT